MTEPGLLTVVVHAAEEGGYWAEVAELPGCVSQGETLDELKDNITEAIRDCLEARMADEEPDPVVVTWSVPYPRNGMSKKEETPTPA